MATTGNIGAQTGALQNFSLSLPQNSPILSNYQTAPKPPTSTPATPAATPQMTLAQIQAGLTSAQNQAQKIQQGVASLPPPAAPQFQNSPFGVNQTTPPNTTGTGTAPPPTDTPVNQSSPADSLLEAYMKSLQPNPDQLALQQQSAALEGAMRQNGTNQGLSNSLTEGQAIPLGEVTGQEANIAKQYQLQNQTLNNQQQTVQAKLANLQAQRQSGIDVAKAALDYSKPVSVAYGSQLVNPQSGSVVNGGVFNGGTGSGVNPATGLTAASTSTDILGYLTQNGVQTTRYNIPGLLNAVQNGATAQDIISGKVSVAAQTAAGTSGSTYKGGAIPGTYVQPNPVLGTPSSSGGAYQAGQLTKLLQSQGKPTDDASLAALYKQIGGQGNYVNDTAHNSQIYGALNGGSSSGSSSTSSGNQYSSAASIRADADSLKTQQTYADSTQRAFNTANQNLQALIPFMQKAGVNSASTIPLINSIQKSVNAHLLDAGTIAAFQAALAGLRAEYAQVLSRGGEVTDSQRTSAATLIPDNLTPAQLQQVATRLNVEGTNAVQEANAQVQTIKDRMNGKTSTSTSGGSGSAGGSNPLGI